MNRKQKIEVAIRVIDTLMWASICLMLFMLVSCETMRISGSIGYVDQESGAKGGLTFTDEGSGWWVRLPAPKDSNIEGNLIIEGDIDITSGK